MPVFVSGLELSRRFFHEAVRPLVTSVFPDLRYAAALLGQGSEVLGFDNELSVDHDWGPRVFILLQKTGLKAPRIHAGDEKPAPAGAIPLHVLLFYDIVSTWNMYMRVI